MIKDLVLTTKKPKCPGLIFRGAVSNYYNSDKQHLGQKKTLRLLKKKSCPGCDVCGGLWDIITEEIDNDPTEDHLAEIEDGKYYTVRVLTSQGYFDQYPEIDGIDFVEYKEE